MPFIGCRPTICPKRIDTWPGNVGIHPRMHAIVSFAGKIATLFELLVDGSIIGHTHQKWFASPTPSWWWGIMRQVIATNCSNYRRAAHPGTDGRLRPISSWWWSTGTRHLWDLPRVMHSYKRSLRPMPNWQWRWTGSSGPYTTSLPWQQIGTSGPYPILFQPWRTDQMVLWDLSHFDDGQ